MSIVLTLQDWAGLFGHYLMLSLLSVGGAITTVPDMHRYLVDEHGWLGDAQFNASIAIAQAAPGPNVLFVALLGWNLGLNAGGYGSALLGMAVCMLGILLPGSVLAFVASRWGGRNSQRREVRAFKQGLAPIVVALMVATGWILTRSGHEDPSHWPLWLLSGLSALVMWRTRVHLLWLLGLGALLGALGWV
ncbi:MULTISPECIES: chromate transporter [Ramlibacter]|uniref:Chromate transporter n=1 Tax=Ramlibacter aquaticus TaxID=2780094 RepID=A0ABR9SJZ2_9BURK|nr:MULTISPECIES: chromate transporter [Ramlibacter]MBE7942092.1 chromate transporter [Ramlibacter aquaticus]